MRPIAILGVASDAYSSCEGQSVAGNAISLCGRPVVASNTQIIEQATIDTMAVAESRQEKSIGFLTQRIVKPQDLA